MPSQSTAARATQPADLSVIVVNCDSAHYLYPCLSSVVREAEGMVCEILVVDDGSFDGAAEIVTELFPEARFLQSRERMGLTRANNLAYRRSTGRRLLFLAPDAELTEGSLRRLYQCLDSGESIGVAGARLLNSDFTIQPRSIQRFPTIWRQALESETLRRRFPEWRIWGIHPLFEDQPGSVAVDAVSGACLLIERSLFEQVGGFSEDYFNYCHDVDLCRRVRRAGLEVRFVGQSWVIHHGEAGMARFPRNHFHDVMMRQALRTFFRRTRGPVYASAFQAVMAAAAVGRLALLGALLPPSRLLRDAGALPQLFDKWVHLLRWAVGLERP